MKKYIITMGSISALVFLASAIFMLFIFNKNYKLNTDISQEKVYQLTGFVADDSAEVKKLKSNALDSYLATGKTDLVSQLEDNKKLLNDLSQGTLELEELKPTKEKLKSALAMTDEQIDKLVNNYYISRLKKDTEALTSKNTSVVSSEILDYSILIDRVISEVEVAIEAYQEDINSPNLPVIEAANIQLVAASVNLKNFKTFITTLQNYSGASQESLQEINLNQSLVANYSQIVAKLESYIIASANVKEQNQRYTEFKEKYNKNEDLAKNSIKLPNLVGMTLKEAKAKLGSDLKLSIKSGDQSENAKILSQEPALASYESIKKGSSVQVVTTPDPKASQTSSSSSSQSTSSSSSKKK